MRIYNFVVILLFCVFVLFSSNTKRNFDSLNKILFEKVGKQLDPYPDFLKTKSLSEEMQETIDQYNLALLKKKINYLESIYLDSNIDLILSKYYEEIEKNILQHTLEIKRNEDELQRGRFQKKKLELESYSLREKRNKEEKKLQKFIFEKKQEYTYKPYDDKTGILKVSDRKVKFPIILQNIKQAQKVLDKISFYTSQNDYPIFLMMDYAYGGSFYAISLIMQAVENSTVPIYVVAKFSVSSGAAAILARAKHSFCYPTTIVTLTEAVTSPLSRIIDYSSYKEGLNFIKEYGARIYLPIIKKMNQPSIKTVDQLYERIRKENVRRYWMETGIGAKKNNWVSAVVEDIRDDSIDNYDRHSFDMKSLLKNRINNLPSLTTRYDSYFIYIPNYLK